MLIVVHVCFFIKTLNGLLFRPFVQLHFWPLFATLRSTKSTAWESQWRRNRRRKVKLPHRRTKPKRRKWTRANDSPDFSLEIDHMGLYGESQFRYLIIRALLHLFANPSFRLWPLGNFVFPNDLSRIFARMQFTNKDHQIAFYAPLSIQRFNVSFNSFTFYNIHNFFISHSQALTELFITAKMMMETDYGFVNSNKLQTVGNVLFAHDKNYFKSFLNNLNALRINKQLCDVEIECHGETLLAHKGLRKSFKNNKK